MSYTRDTWWGSRAGVTAASSGINFLSRKSLTNRNPLPNVQKQLCPAVWLPSLDSMSLQRSWIQGHSPCAKRPWKASPGWGPLEGWECAPAHYCKSGIVASIWLESRCLRKPTLHHDLRPALPRERSRSPPLGSLPLALQGCSCEACDLKRSAQLTVPTLMSNGRKTSEILPKAS